MPRTLNARDLLVIALTLSAFAGNSLLCRLALRETALDPASFTGIRLGSAALMLSLLLALRGQRGPMRRDWRAALALFAYAAAFSLAYVRLDAGIGALLLFGAVQVSMTAHGLASGERLRLWGWFGLALAVAGLALLLLPGASAPPLLSGGLMLAAGVAWGVYSVLGRGSADALAATAANFVLSLPLTLAFSLIFAASARWDTTGAVYAVLSGAVTSGLGYALWYSVLPRLGSLQAATLQLSVPVLAALGGVLLLGEALSLRMMAAGALVLLGVAVVIRARRPAG